LPELDLEISIKIYFKVHEGLPAEYKSTATVVEKQIMSHLLFYMFLFM